MNHIEKCFHNEVFMTEFLNQLDDAKISKIASLIVKQIDSEIPKSQNDKLKSHFGKFSCLNKENLQKMLAITSEFYVSASDKRYKLICVSSETKLDEEMGLFDEYMDAKEKGEKLFDDKKIIKYTICDCDSVGENHNYETSNEFSKFALLTKEDYGYSVVNRNSDKKIKCSNEQALKSILSNLDKTLKQDDLTSLVQYVNKNNFAVFAFDFYGPNPPNGSNNSSVDQRTKKTNDISDSEYDTWPDVVRMDIVVENDPVSLDNNIGYGRGKNVQQDTEMMKNDNNRFNVKDNSTNRFGDTSDKYKEYSETMQLSPKSSSLSVSSADHLRDESADIAKLEELSTVVREYLVAVDTIQADLELQEQELEKYYGIPALEDRVNKILPEIRSTISGLRQHEIVVQNVEYKLKDPYTRMELKKSAEIEEIIAKIKDLVKKGQEEKFEELHQQIYKTINVRESFTKKLAPEQQEIEEVRQQIKDKAKQKIKKPKKQKASMISADSLYEKIDDSLVNFVIDFDTYNVIKASIEEDVCFAQELVDMIPTKQVSGSFGVTAGFMESVKEYFSQIYGFIENILKPFTSWLEFSNSEWEKIGDSLESENKQEGINKEDSRQL